MMTVREYRDAFNKLIEQGRGDLLVVVFDGVERLSPAEGPEYMPAEDVEWYPELPGEVVRLR